jgi:hypothetical protein
MEFGYSLESLYTDLATFEVYSLRKVLYQVHDDHSKLSDMASLRNSLKLSRVLQK